jgi:predicted metal-dependent phosphoesterase TrpH
MPQTVKFAWRDSEPSRPFSAGVSLHGHTMHSEECLSFLPRYLHRAPGISQIVSGYERGPEPVDFARAYWTPPLSPASALRVERKQIENMDLRSLVSLTDHDNIEAGMSLQVASDPCEVPVSVEWTVPYAQSIFHLGVHNLPPASARELMSTLTAFSASPNEELLPGILRELAEIRDVLIVLNHPFWLEEGIEQADHARALTRILSKCIDSIHAFELNGTRVWKENKKVGELAREYSKPLISGGDRHACEPSACINLTNAASFSEFVSEIRSGYSVPYFMAHYREPMTLRILEAARDILRPYPAYPGRERWTDRIFYRGDDGLALPLSQVWRDRTPWVMNAPLNAATGFLQLLTAPGLRATMRHFLAERGEILP